MSKKVIIPEYIVNKLESALINNSPTFRYKKELGLYFLSLILSIPSKKREIEYKDEYIPINSKICRLHYKYYNKYFDYFVENKILERKNYSTQSHTCNSYKYIYEQEKKQFEYQDYKFYDISGLFQSYKGFKQYTISDEIMKDCGHLLKWFNTHLTIDVEEAQRIIQPCLGYYTSDWEHKMEVKAKKYLYTILTFKEHNYWASRKNYTDNRLHTPLTTLSKKLRPCLSYKDQKLVSIDIKNSQPLFLIVLIHNIGKKYKDKESRVKKIIESKIKKIGKVKINDIYTPILHLIRESFFNKEFQEEYLLLKNWILGGIFYEEMGKVINPVISPDGKYKRYFFDSIKQKKILKEFSNQRDLMKKLTLEILYTPLEKPSNEYKIFKAKFPKIINFIELLKSKKYQDFPKLLQNIEADCVIDYVTFEISKKYPDIPLWTIHDSIVTTESNADSIYDEFERLIIEYTNGIAPKLEKELWIDPNINIKEAS